MENLLLEAYVFNVYILFESRDTEVFKADRSKLFASNEKQIDNHTLILDIKSSSVVCTYHCRGVYKNIFQCGCCSLLIFVAKKATRGTELQFFLYTRYPQSGRVEDHRKMSIRHLHLLQLCIQAILHIY